MILGKTTNGHEFHISDDARARHVHIVGQTGTGKSSLLLNMIAADLAAGHGIAVVDPHGELAESVLALVPPERFSQVRYLNPVDEKPVPFNPLHAVALEDRPRVADAVVSAFRAVWGWTPETAPRALPLLRNAIRTALDLPSPTFLDVMRIVDEGRGRQKATDPLNRRYWKRLESREQRYQDEAVDPVYTRLDTLLTPLVRGVLCQRPTFNLSQLMNDGQILICNLNKGAIGELNSHLLGAFIVSGIVQAAFNRSPQFHQRRFYVFADEFQNYATDSFATGLSEARKVGLVFAGLAHQYLGQLPESVRSAVFGNTGTTVVFRVGAEDASLLAAHTGGWVGDYDLPPAILKELPNYHCVVRVLRGGVPYTVRLETPPPPEPVHDRVEQLVRNSRTRFGRPRSLVERAINSRLAPPRRKRTRKW